MLQSGLSFQRPNLITAALMYILFPLFHFPCYWLYVNLSWYLIWWEFYSSFYNFLSLLLWVFACIVDMGASFHIVLHLAYYIQFFYPYFPLRPSFHFSSVRFSLFPLCGCHSITLPSSTLPPTLLSTWPSFFIWYLPTLVNLLLSVRSPSRHHFSFSTSLYGKLSSLSYTSVYFFF